MHRTLLVVALLGLSSACDDEAGGPLEPDAALRNRDASILPPPTDAFTAGDAALPRDAASDVGVSGDAGADPDAGPTPRDDGDVPDPDARVVPDPDAAAPDADAAPPDPDAGPPDDRCEAALAAANFDFESGGQGFEHAIMDGVDGDWPFDPWQQGRATSGPGACHTGNGCWATDLDDNLVQCQRADLRSPPIDLGACADREIELVFDHWYAFWAGRVDGLDFADGGTVEAANIGEFFEVLAPGSYPGVIRINPRIEDGFDEYACLAPDDFYVDGLPGFVQSSGGWEEVRLPLGGLHRGGPFRFRLAYSTGVSRATFDPDESQATSPPGWYLDGVRFEVR